MRIKVALVGHPNVGKSVIFNNLTGLKAIVSNYPGTTVEIYEGKTRWKDFIIELIDTPGTYSLVPTTQAEEVTCRVILEERPDVIVHVVDATSIRRHLYLTLELLEVGAPVVLVVNQIDRAEALGVKIRKEELSRLLNIPVVMCIATKRVGMITLLDKIIEAYKRRSIAYPRYPKIIEEYLGLIEKMLKEELPPDLKRFSRFIAIHVILGNKIFNRLARAIPEHLKIEFPKYSRQIILERARIADEVYKEAVSIRETKQLKLSRIDYISVNPIFGVTIIAGLTLAVTYSLLGLIHEIGHRIPSMLYYNLYEPFIRSLIESVVPQGLLHDILIGEKAGIYGSLGLLTTGVFFVFFMILPTIFVLYLVLGMLEDLGFLPRVAISFHRPLRKIGLSGDATMPLVIGTGCSIVGVLSTRILRSDKERFISSLLQVLGIPCMAQQVMIWYILGKHGVLYIFALYLLLLFTVVTLGAILNKIIPGETGILLLELPPWRKPQLRNLLKKTYVRMLSFLKTGVPLVFLGIFLINLAYYTGAIAMIAEFFSPIMSGLFRLPSETCIALVVSVLRKDVAVGILGRYKLTALQKLTAVAIITLSFPCVGSLAITLSEFGVRRTLKIIAIMFVTSLVVGSFLGFLSSLFAI